MAGEEQDGTVTDDGDLRHLELAEAARLGERREDLPREQVARPGVPGRGTVLVFLDVTAP